MTITAPSEFSDSHILNGYVTRAALAAQLGKSERTLEFWATRRIGPPYARIGKLIVYNVDDVRAWIDAQKVKPPVRTRPRRRPASPTTRSPPGASTPSGLPECNLGRSSPGC